jgi:hypothetical protein
MRQNATWKRTKSDHLDVKLEAFAHYGEACECCGESWPVFLTLDHINRDGAEHRRKIGKGGTRMYRWLRRNRWPKGFRTLCFNCNSATHVKFKCPHKTTMGCSP